MNATQTQVAQSSLNVTTTTVEKILDGALPGFSLLDSVLAETESRLLDSVLVATMEAETPVIRKARKPSVRKSATVKTKKTPAKRGPAPSGASATMLQSIYRKESEVVAEWQEEEGEPDEEYSIDDRLVHCGTSYIVRWTGKDKRTNEPRLGLSRFSAGKIELFIATSDLSEETPADLPTVSRGDSVEYATKSTGKVNRYVVGSVRGTRVYLKFCSSKRRGFWTDLKNCKPVATPKGKKKGVCVVCGLASCNIGPFSC